MVRLIKQFYGRSKKQSDGYKDLRTRGQSAVANVSEAWNRAMWVHDESECDVARCGWPPEHRSVEVTLCWVTQSDLRLGLTEHNELLDTGWRYTPFRQCSIFFSLRVIGVYLCFYNLCPLQQTSRQLRDFSASCSRSVV